MCYWIKFKKKTKIINNLFIREQSKIFFLIEFLSRALQCVNKKKCVRAETKWEIIQFSNLTFQVFWPYVNDQWESGRFLPLDQSRHVFFLATITNLWNSRTSMDAEYAEWVWVRLIYATEVKNRKSHEQKSIVLIEKEKHFVFNVSINGICFEMCVVCECGDKCVFVMQYHSMAIQRKRFFFSCVSF